MKLKLCMIVWYSECFMNMPLFLIVRVACARMHLYVHMYPREIIGITPKLTETLNSVYEA